MSQLEMSPVGGYGPSIELFDQTFCNVSRSQARDIVESMVRKPRDTAWLVCVKDVALTMRCRDDAGLGSFYRRADVVFVDGKGLCYASRLVGRPLREMVGGPGLYEELLRLSALRGYRVYFLGARPEVVSRAVAHVAARHPGLTIAGANHGYLDAEQRRRVAQSIRDSGAQIVLVGMATPAREAFLAETRASLGGTVCVFVGGMFDVEAGVTKLAPRLVSELGLEWLFRCWQEPRRLAGRYLRTHPRFVLLLLAAILRRGIPLRGTRPQ